MAKIQFAAWVDEVAGKVGGAVMARGKSSQIIRKLVKGKNPNTQDQIEVRGRMRFLSKKWRTLSEGQRIIWGQTASDPSWRREDSLGQQFQLSGFNFYMAVNLRLMLIGASVIDNAPEHASFDAVTVLTCTATETGPTFDFTYTGTLGGSKGILVTADRPFSKGIMSYYQGRFKYITYTQESSPVSIADAMIDDLGTWVEGDKFWVWFLLVDDASSEDVDLGVFTVIVGA